MQLPRSNEPGLAAFARVSTLQQLWRRGTLLLAFASQPREVVLGQIQVPQVEAEAVPWNVIQLQQRWKAARASPKEVPEAGAEAAFLPQAAVLG
jgi:hypothetical protein